MTDYQIYTLDSGGLVLGSHNIFSETDATARAFCKRCLPEGGLAELWKDEKRIEVIWIAASSTKLM